MGYLYKLFEWQNTIAQKDWQIGVEKEQVLISLS